MMTLEEAIEHYKEIATESRAAALTYARENYYETAISCKAYGQECEQLAKWLTELKQRREAEISENPKTNGDRIRQMKDDEELLSAIGTGCYRCAYNNGECDSGYGKGCFAGNLEFLKQEVSEDEDK